MWGVKINNKFFDFLLFNKLIIEFDGEYYHSSEEAKKNDLYKDLLAKENGYIIFRVKYTERKELTIIQKIKEIIDEIQANSNKENRN